jgi:predicted RNA-binding protein with PUA-like domain
MSRRYWLMKSEPSAYSVDDWVRDGVTSWEGVRNYQARNYMKEQAIGDRVLFYHSSAEPSGVVGVGEVCRLAYPDHTATTPGHKYFDDGSDASAPTWFMVDVKIVEKLPRCVTLAELKADPALDGMLVTRKGQRLSVMPVEPAHFEHVVAMSRRAP